MPHECTNCGLTFPDGSKEMLSGCPDCGGNKFQFHPGGTSPDAGGASPDETRSSQSSAADSSPSTDADTSGDQSGRSSPRADVASENPRRDTTAPKSTDSSFTLGSLRSEKSDSDPPDAASESTPDEEAPGTTPGEKPPPSTDQTRNDSSPNTEDRAQASARSTIPSGDELQKSDPGGTSHTRPSDSDTSRTEPQATEPTDTEATGDAPGPPDDSDPPDISELREELNEQFESIKIHARGEYELNLMELYDREEHIIALQEDGRYVIDVPSSWREADEDD